MNLCRACADITSADELFHFAVERLPIGYNCCYVFICSTNETKSLYKEPHKAQQQQKRNNPDSVSRKILGGPPKRLNSKDGAFHLFIAPHNFQSNQTKPLC